MSQFNFFLLCNWKILHFLLLLVALPEILAVFEQSVVKLGRISFPITMIKFWKIIYILFGKGLTSFHPCRFIYGWIIDGSAGLVFAVSAVVDKTSAVGGIVQHFFSYFSYFLLLTELVLGIIVSFGSAFLPAGIPIKIKRISRHMFLHSKIVELLLIAVFGFFFIEVVPG